VGSSLEALAGEVGLSPGRRMHVFTESIGIPLRPYVAWLKLQRAAAAIASGQPLAPRLKRRLRTLAEALASLSILQSYGKPLPTVAGLECRRVAHDSVLPVHARCVAFRATPTLARSGSHQRPRCRLIGQS
jgi:hypothetical protein